MKKGVTLTILFSVLLLSACKNKNKDAADQGSSPSSAPAANVPASGSANQPKQYQVKISPDTALLGKKNEALVKISGGTAVALQDPDGKDNGIELTLNLNVTNKLPIGNDQVSVSYADSRLQLDNGTNITSTKGSDFLNAKPESTSKTESWTYTVPSGSKPVALNLFMNETRVSVKVTLE